MFVSALGGQAPGFRGIKVLRLLMPTDSWIRVSGLWLPLLHLELQA